MSAVGGHAEPAAQPRDVGGRRRGLDARGLERHRGELEARVQGQGARQGDAGHDADQRQGGAHAAGEGCRVRRRGGDADGGPPRKGVQLHHPRRALLQLPGRAATGAEAGPRGRRAPTQGAEADRVRHHLRCGIYGKVHIHHAFRRRPRREGCREKRLQRYCRGERRFVFVGPPLLSEGSRTNFSHLAARLCCSSRILSTGTPRKSPKRSS